MRNLLDVFVLVAVALVLAGLPGSAAQDDLSGKRAKWVAEYQDLQMRHARLEQDLEQARADYSRGRSTKHLRGEGKAGLLKEIARLEDEFAKADEELKDFPDKARRAGALPGWFRDLEAPSPEPVQPAAAVAPPEPSHSRESERDRRAAERKHRRPGGE